MMPAEGKPVPEVLPVGYYLEHFRTLLDAVEERYGDLLNDAEKSFISTFRALPVPGQRLYVRLISRQGPVFRSDRLAYSEIPDLPAVVAKLVQGQFLSLSDPEWFAAAFALLTSPELKKVGAQFSIACAGLRKGEIQAVLQKALTPELLSAALLSRFHWLAPLGTDMIRVFRLLFFGTSEPDLTAFVLSDLGKVTFESYPLMSSHRLFTSRGEVDRAVRLSELREELYTVLEEQEENEDTSLTVERLTGSLPPAAGHPLLCRWRRRFLEMAGRFWERKGRAERALELYADPETLPARDRRARLLLRQGNEPDALRQCEEILATPRDPAEEEVAAALAGRMRSGGRGSARFCPLVERLSLPANSDDRVEARVLDALIRRGEEGFEAENRFWNSLFGLVFWEIIFLPVPRAFVHPFQSSPSDLFTSGFRQAREEPVQRRLSELIAGESWRSKVLSLYDQKRGVANALVNWEAISRPTLERVLEVLPSRHLMMICDRLSRNPGGFTSGFPDLFLFRSGPPGYELAEVKSPGDRLQDNQRSWMRFFAAQGIPCRVIQVEFEESVGG